VLFVPAGLVGGTADWLPEPRGERLLDAEELRVLAQEGLVEVASHACEHIDMRGLDRTQLDRQATRARGVLQELTGSPIRAFAYPFGAHDSNARDAVASAGYVAGFSVFEDDGPFAVSRVDVNATDTLSSFRLKLVPGYRTWWRVLGRASFVRRLVRRQLTRRAESLRGPERGTD
jgi:peptidoglycan/xylan/chitin deacetylase (PgdA/CDA1 family)